MADSHSLGWAGNGTACRPCRGSFSKVATGRIASVAQRVRYASGRTLFAQGEPGKDLYIVERGAVEISVLSANGKKLSLNIMRVGDAFGEIAMLDDGVRTANATVIESATLLRASRSDLDALMKKDPELAAELIAMLCSRLRWVSQLVEDLGLLGIRERLASRLIVLDGVFPERRGDLPLSQSELADFLGATRESINKALRTWQAEGLIRLSRGSIRILDRARLAGHATAQH